MKKILLTLCFFYFSHSALALTLREPKSVSIEAGKAFKYDLEDEVTQSVTGDIEFTLNDAPGWLRLDGDRLFGTPPVSKDLGPTVVSYRAREKKLSSPAVEGRIVLNVFATPELPEELNLGILDERKKFELNLRTRTKHPALDTLAYRVHPSDKLPQWLKLGGDGLLSGTPERADAGRRFEFRVWVTSNYGGKSEIEIEGRVKKIPVSLHWTKKEFELPPAKEDAPYRAQIPVEWIDNPEKTRLRFKFLEQTNPWVELSWDGTLRGIPHRADIGKKTWTVQVETTVDEQVFQENAKISLTTEKINKPPVWKNRTIQLPLANSGQKFESKALIENVSDADADKITFQFTPGSGPEWLQLQPDGILKANLKPEFAGKHRWKVTASDGQLSADATVEFIVENHPPVWKSLLPALPDAVQSQIYTYDFKPLAEDADKDPLTFTARQLPPWLKLEDGKITGTPERTEVGIHRVRIQVSDGPTSAMLETSLKVILKAYPPEPHLPVMQVQMKERAQLEIPLGTPKYVEDLNQDVLKFRWETKAPAWVTLEETGRMILQPKHSEVGKQNLNLVVTDGKFSVPFVFKVDVKRDARAPEWKSPEIALETLTRESFKIDLNQHVTDLDKEKLTFTKRSGPEWFALTPEGILTAQPKDEQAGDYSIRVQAQNDVLSSSAKLLIKVKFKNTPPKWKVSSINLPSGRAQSFYTQGFAEHATDIDTFQQLKFSKASGPAWTVVDPAGRVFGNPAPSDVGKVSMEVRVDDGAGGSATATLHFSIETANSAPVASVTGSIPLPVAYQGELFLFNLAPIFKDTQGDKLTFRKTFGPEWLRVSKTGEVTGVPGPETFGQYNAIFEAHDGTTGVQVKAQGLVRQP